MAKLKFIFLALSLFLITGCSDKVKIDDEMEKSDMELVTNIKVSVDDNVYVATLENNETVQAFLEKLPQEFVMNELNGNEKYVYLDSSLPIDEYSPKHIEAGDIMLYGNDCLVIFYKSFDTKYSYTKVGHIVSLPDLGSSNVKVKFERE